MSDRHRDYDRGEAARILARLAAPGLFVMTAPSPSTVTYTASALVAEPGQRLTLSQRLYLERFMAPCRPEQVTSATHRITWTDTTGVVNTGHYGPSEIGAVMPIAVRETVLALWRGLAANEVLAEAALDLSDDDVRVLAATTTDQEPIEIFRIGIEATGRALAQHALVADTADPAEFAKDLRASEIFTAVAVNWYWELQASTYRRGMVPVSLTRGTDGRLRYPADSVAVLTAMKRQTIADAHETMRRATEEEGLTVAQAVGKYHTDLDLISRQYALMDRQTRPRCLASMPAVVDGVRVSVISQVVDAFVETFLDLLPGLQIRQVPAAAAEQTAAEDRIFLVPDMNCKHCKITITAVLESQGIEVGEVDLLTKRVVAMFDTRAQRDAAFSAIRDSGYTIVQPAAR
jgi:copper chaperone CopZ